MPAIHLADHYSPSPQSMISVLNYVDLFKTKRKAIDFWKTGKTLLQAVIKKVNRQNIISQNKFLMINRSAILLRYNEPAIRWINDSDPIDDTFSITEEVVNSDRTVYLISDDDGENEQTQKTWIKRNFKNLFQSELEGWYTDPSLWPGPLTLELFRKWFDVECHTVLIDTVGGKIFDDGI